MVNTPTGSRNLQGQTALVTGASYGVGAATAIALAEAGANVVLTATRSENLNATVEALGKYDVHTAGLSLDLGDQKSIDSTIESAGEAFNGIDILVNNAARSMRKSAIDVTRSDWDSIMSANLTGTYFITTAFARTLIKSGRTGCVVNIASVHGLIGAAERSVYGVSKGGMVQMTRLLAIEWAKHGIRVNAVAPGRMDTPSPSRAATAKDPDYLKAMLDRIPMHRMTTADEVAAAVVFLAAPMAASITGQVIVLDGGLSVA